jgi:hypothetical protein
MEAAWSPVHLVDEVLDHLFCYVDVGDHAVAERSDRLDVRGRLTHHELGVGADSQNLGNAITCFDRHDGRLVENHTAMGGEDDRVHRAQIDRHVVGGQGEGRGEPQQAQLLWCWRLERREHEERYALCLVDPASTGLS